MLNYLQQASKGPGNPEASLQQAEVDPRGSRDTLKTANIVLRRQPNTLRVILKASVSSNPELTGYFGSV